MDERNKSTHRLEISWKLWLRAGRGRKRGRRKTEQMPLRCGVTVCIFLYCNVVYLTCVVVCVALWIACTVLICMGTHLNSFREGSLPILRLTQHLTPHNSQLTVDRYTRRVGGKRDPPPKPSPMAFVQRKPRHSVPHNLARTYNSETLSHAPLEV